MHRASSPLPDGGPELCLRFPCPGCQERLFVPVEQLRRSHFDQCPKCHRAVEFPAIDDNIAGYRHIVPKVRSKKIECPKCSAELRVPPAPPGDRQQCPACQTVLMFQLVTEPQPQAPVDRNAKKAQPAPTPKAKSSERPAKSAPRPSPSPPPPPVNPSTSASDSERPPDSEKQTKPKPDETAAEITDFTPEPVPQPVVYGGQTASSWTGRGGTDLSSSPRLTFWLLYFGLHFLPPTFGIGLFVLTHKTSVVGLTGAIAGLTCVWLVFGFYPSRLLAGFITPLIVTTLKCPGCAEQFPAVSHWNCACGYHDHRERHILNFRCPKCSSVLGYFDCEQCESTIIIR